MTLDELMEKHCGNSRARRLLGDYGDVLRAIERCASRFRAEGDSRWADSVQSVGHGLLQQARRHADAVALPITGEVLVRQPGGEP